MAFPASNSRSNICLVIMASFISMISLSYQSDSILAGQSIQYNQTIISQAGIFELGFRQHYHEDISFYVGIWYKSDPSTEVWIANRDTPIRNSDIDAANLILAREGDLQLQVNGQLIWNTNATTTDPNTTKAVLLDSGNLIIGSDSSPDMWESFNHPTDTWLPGAKIGLDVTTGKTDSIILTNFDNGDGYYSLGIDQSGSSELLIWNNVTNTAARIGASDFSDANLKSKLNIAFNVSRTNGINYATYHTLNSSTPTRMVLGSDGQLRLYIWNGESADWLNVWTRPKVCSSDAACGSNGICSMSQSPLCSCPEGFQPKYKSYWELHDYSGGCVKRNGSQCLKAKDKFIALDNIIFPSYGRHYEEHVNCHIACANNCSCSAYTKQMTFCLMWYGDLPSMEYDAAGGMAIFIRSSSIELPKTVILPGQSIYFNQSITSQGGIFELGFYRYVYVGIWYKSDPSTAVWIANRDTPIPDYGTDVATLTLTREGDLRLQVYGQILWNTSTTTTDLNPTEATLLDSGNLIVGSRSSPYMWESFNYPTDTWLPGAKIGLDLTTGKTEPTILSVGNYTFGTIDPCRPSELLIRNNKSKTASLRASDFSKMNLGFMLNITFNASIANGVNYATYHILNGSSPIRMVLDIDGQLRLYIWKDKYASWLNVSTSPKVLDSYAPCGSNGICSMNQNPVCSCPEGFQPKHTLHWKLHDYSEGCVRRSGSQCPDDKDEFIALDNIKMPPNYQILSSGSADVCQVACAANCNCSAYRNTSGCYLWFGDLVDMRRTYNMTATETVFLKLGSRELPNNGAKKVLRITLGSSISFLILVLGFFSYYICRKKITGGAKDRGQDLLLFDLEMTNKRHADQVQSNSYSQKGNRDLALPIFSLSSIFSATNNFSLSNKLGEGGFGPVYKGKLRNGQEVAIKRLSKHSGQGLGELINEAKLIAKLKHTNLVRLLGCCIQKDEKILVYEFMPNKSLDFFLFDPVKRKTLDWSKRMRIIEGIAQGLLYLHHYSRLRIVHRDLKASNILLDADMKPKISDFGMARIFGGDQLQVNTKHIVGTFGYMPPEYALEGLFSIKTDVFSFGVLLLEILSGERNTTFHHEDCLNLPGYAWKLWTNDTPLELLDPILKTSCELSKALRYIHVGLLCVQEHPDDRPNILDVVAMIANEMKVIEVQPKQPSYLGRRRAPEAQPEKFSINELTNSMMQPR